MKIRKQFVSNSSSTSFIITNTSDEKKTLVDFVEENPQLIENFKEEYDWYRNDKKFTQKNLIKSAKEDEDCDYIFKSNSSQECIFGDEDGTLIGQVFDYILRDGGSSKNFKWRFNKYLR